MRPRPRLLALMLAAGLLLVAAPAVADEAQLDDHGWWWRVQTGATELPAPPFVPEDGMAVSRDVDGPSAVAAVRYEVGDEELTAATLVLEVASEQGGDVAAIRACPAASPWQGASAGLWDERPEADCEAGEVSGSADEETWSFEVSPLAADGVIDIVLLPEEASEEAADGGDDPLGGGSDDGGAAPFQVSFEPPQDESLETSGGIGSGFDGGFDGDSFGDDGQSSGGESTSGESSGPQQGSPPEVSGGAGFDSPAAEESPSGGSGGSESVPAPDVAQAPESGDGASEGTGTGSSAPPSPQVADQEDAPVAMEPVGFGGDRGRQVAALISLLAAAAAGYLFLGDRGMAASGIPGLRTSRIVRPEVVQQRLPAGMTGRGDAQAGGLGRFVKPREGDPPSL